MTAGGAQMKKIRIFLLILTAMFAVQMYEPVTSCDVYAAAQKTTKKSKKHLINFIIMYKDFSIIINQHQGSMIIILFNNYNCINSHEMLK